MNSTASKNDDDGCLNSFRLEIEKVMGTPSSTQTNRRQQHFDHCKRCRRNCETYSSFYTLLAKEICKPVSNKLLDFIKAHSKSILKGGVIVCSRMPQADRGNTKAYHTKLVFATNGNNGHSKLSYYDLSSMPEDQIIFRVLIDSDNQAYLFLWTADLEHQNKRTFQLEDSSTKFRMNKSGAVKINCTSLKELDEKTVYFSKNGNGSAKEELLEQITNSVLF